MKILNLNKCFANKIIFNNASFEFEDGKITYLMGESGIGKTTLLRIIAGLDRNFSAEFSRPDKIAYVFQEPRLFPSLTVKDNIKIVNENSKYDIDWLINLVELNGCENLYPNELSGGMNARVSIARAIYYDADVVLMDEPFSSLNQEMKDRIASKTFSVLSGKTVIVVSHDIAEANLYSNKIIIL